MEKAIFPEPGSPIRFDQDQCQPANSWHLHEAPERETQCQDVSLFEAAKRAGIRPGTGLMRLSIDHNFWRCGSDGNWCKCANPRECRYADKISQL